MATFETSQVLLAGVPGVFFSGFSRFCQPTDWRATDNLSYGDVMIILQIAAIYCDGRLK